MTHPMDVKHGNRWQQGDYLFDGFAHRGYQENLDGWRNEIPDPRQFPCLQQADSVRDLYEALCEARIEIWRLRQELELWKPVGLAACGFPTSGGDKP